MDFSTGSTLEDVISATGIPPNYISFSAVNGEKKELDYEIKDNDEILLLPYITGG